MSNPRKDAVMRYMFKYGPSLLFKSVRNLCETECRQDWVREERS